MACEYRAGVTPWLQRLLRCLRPLVLVPTQVWVPARCRCDVTRYLADLGRQSSAPLPRGGSSAAADNADGAGRVLTPKNMHALRTLFNIAHKLHPVLGSSWILVLENLNSLDRILNSPRTTTQVGSLES